MPTWTVDAIATQIQCGLLSPNMAASSKQTSVQVSWCMIFAPSIDGIWCVICPLNTVPSPIADASHLMIHDFSSGGKNYGTRNTRYHMRPIASGVPRGDQRWVSSFVIRSPIHLTGGKFRRFLACNDDVTETSATRARSLHQNPPAHQSVLSTYKKGENPHCQCISLQPAIASLQPLLSQAVKMSSPTKQTPEGQGVSHAVNDSMVPGSVQERAPKGLEEALPESVRFSFLHIYCRKY